MISELNGLIQHMHYVDFDSKNKQTIIRFAIYIVLGLVAIAVSYLVILGARGYDVDPATRKVVRNGLILTWSQPESVDVYVNGNLEDNTPARFPLPAGQYDMKMSKRGYRDWTKKVDLRASEVIKMNYPRLFPNEIVAAPVSSLSDVSGWLQSGDQETIAVHTKPESKQILFYSVNDIKAAPKLLTIPDQYLTRVDEGIGTINLHQWSADSDYLMIEHVNGTLTEYIRINVINDELININKTMALELTNLQFDRSENNKMYGLTNGQLRRIDLSEEVVSSALVAEVVDYRVASDGRVLAIQKRDKLSSLLMIDRDDNVTNVLSAPTTSTAQLELGNYDNENYALVAFGPNETTLVWLDAKANRKSNVIATIPGKNVRVYPVSFTGRFAVVSSGDIVTVHDFEKLRVFEFKFADMVPESLSWFDDGHLITTTSKGAIDVIEFDGKNKTNIGKGKNYKVYTDKSFKSFYSLGVGQNSKIDLNVSNLRPQ